MTPTVLISVYFVKYSLCSAARHSLTIIVGTKNNIENSILFDRETKIISHARTFISRHLANRGKY
jgi:hypothetical protein